MFTIKQLAKTGLAAMSLIVSAVTAHATTGNHVTMVADGIYRYAPGNRYASMFVVTNDGVVAVEPANTKHAKGMLEAIRSVTDQPVRYLLHSHNHWDHSGGGQVFRDTGAKILAHKDAYDWMKANPRPDLALPDESWNGKRKDITLGDTTIEMHHLGISHGLGMTAFRVMPQKVVYVADLVTPNRVFVNFAPDFNFKGWKRALSEIEALDFDKAIFSHYVGNATYGSKSDVTNIRVYIEDLQAAVADEFKKGTRFSKMPQTVKLPKYENWAMYKEWLPLNVLRVALDMYIGPYPWRPSPDSGQ